jgi:peptidyl-tRNA hydrolase
VYPQLANFYKMLPDEITVIHDDVDLEFGKYEVTKKVPVLQDIGEWKILFKN